METTNSSLFDIFNTDDLPQEVKQEIKKSVVSMDSKYLELVKLKEDISVNEMVVALYRKYGIVKRYNTVYVALYDLHKKGLIAYDKNKRVFNSLVKLNETK